MIFLPLLLAATANTTNNTKKIKVPGCDQLKLKTFHHLQPSLSTLLGPENIKDYMNKEPWIKGLKNHAVITDKRYLQKLIRHGYH
jgi:hypothetical protein